MSRRSLNRRMKGFSRKFWCIALSVVLVVSFIPSAALADLSEDEAAYESAEVLDVQNDQGISDQSGEGTADVGQSDAGQPGTAAETADPVAAEPQADKQAEKEQAADESAVQDKAPAIIDDAQTEQTAKVAKKAAGAKGASTQDELDEAIIEYADGLYTGENSASRIGLIAELASSSTHPESAKAGDTVKYTLTYRYEVIDTWEERYDAPRTLFDSYQNSKVTVTLPAGLAITHASENYNWTKTPNEDGTSTYTFPLAEVDGASELSFDIDVYVCGNGTADAIGTFDLEKAVEFSTEFTVKNKSEEPYRDLKTYTQKKAVDLADITAQSPDEWGVQKTAKSAAIDDDTLVATVTYKIDVGLKNGKGGLITSASDYNRFGRDAFAGIGDSATPWFEDDLSAEIISGPMADTALEPDSVTIQKDGSEASVALTEEAPLELTGDLALNTVKVDSDGDGVLDQPVPSYTSYTVVAKYQLTADEVDHFSAPGSEAEFTNEVDMVYKLAKKDQATETDSDSITAKLPVLKPATLTVVKKLKTVSGTDTYKNEYGSISFTVSSVNGEKFQLFTKSGTTYSPTAEPSTSFGVTTGTVYYLTPGIEYQVVEDLTSDQRTVMWLNGTASKDLTATPTPGQEWTALFQNDEQIGRLTVTKYDDHGAVVPGVTFELLDCYDRHFDYAVTGKDGTAVFDRVPFDTYTLVETDVPAGYVNSFTPKEVTIGSNNQDAVETAVNKKNFASISLTKYVAVAEPFSSTTKADADFAGTFVLQRTVASSTVDPDEAVWETVPSDIYGTAVATTVNASGKITATVPAYDEEEQPYLYRFVETIPTGYYDPADPAAATAVSDAVTLVDENGKALPNPVNVNMYNRQKVTVNVQKEFWSIDGTKSAMKKDGTLTTDVALYCYDAEQEEMVQVQDAQTAGARGSASWSGLVMYRDGELLQYYVSEEDVAGYKLDIPESQSVMTIDGTDYLAVDVADTATVTKTLYNVEQSVPVIIYKKNCYTKEFVSGAGVTVKDGTSVAKDAKSAASLEDQAIASQDGLVVYLAPGKKYDLVETVNNTGLISVNATAAHPLSIDLTGISLGMAQSAAVPVQSYNVYNKPDPAIKIVKTDAVTGASGTNVLKTAVFTVFQKDGDVYTAVADGSGNPVTVQATGAATSVRLPVGTYYLAETTVPDGYLDPTVVPAEYNGIVRGTTDTGETYSFFPFAVKDGVWTEGTAADNVAQIAIANQPNSGSLKVAKYIDGAAGNFSGYSIIVKNGDATAASGTTGANGTVTLTDLPVYDASGQKITYTIYEGELTSEQAELYYKYADGMQAQLSVGTVTSKDAANNVLRVDNQTFTTLEVNKVYHNTWDYKWTGMQYPLAGVTVGLFELDTATDTWNLVKTATTGDSGVISFDKAYRTKSYAVVELSCTNPYMLPVSGGEVKDYAGTKTAISAEELRFFNVLTIDAQTPETVRSLTENLGTFVNEDRWVQFDITKWLDADPLNAERSNFGTEVDQYADTKYDNAIYNLYRAEVPEDQTAITFDSSWELMGTYASGTFYENNGERKAGEFRTDVDQKASENVIYVLKEMNAGPGGAVINPNFQYTVYQCAARSSNCTVTVPGASTVRQEIYGLNNINHDTLLNSKPEGGSGGSEIMTAAIRLAKWKDDFDASGNPLKQYKALPNVSFGVYLDADCSASSQLEILTVGLDNESNVNVKAWAQSAAYVLTVEGDTATATTGQLTLYADAGMERTLEVPVTLMESTETYDVLGVQVYISEMGAPTGFTQKTGSLPMMLCFVHAKNGDNPEAFNDAYFVTSSTADVPQTDTQFNTTAYVTWGSGSGAGLFATDGQYRIVDYPMQDTKVSVQKYGYTPDSTTVGKTAGQLNTMDLSTRQALAGVVFCIQRQDANGTWRYWNYRESVESGTEMTFTTRADGGYTFAKGLPAGTYRIWEKSLGGTANVNTYMNAYADADHARVFTVGDDPMTVTLYNPTKPKVTLLKTDMDGAGKMGTVFAMRHGKAWATNRTDPTGHATFIISDNDTYFLQEQLDGFSSAYLQDYAASTGDANLIALTGDGLFLGYTYERVGDASDGEWVIASIGAGDTSFSYTIPNPPLGSLSLQKTSEKDGAALTGAVFQEQYMKFSTWSGTMNVSGLDAEGWKALGTVTSGSNGLISLTGLEPGIYAFCETQAPAGYDIIRDSAGKDIVYYAVVTSGMDVTVTGLPETATVLKSDETTSYTVQTLFVDPTAAIVAKNRPMTTASAAKTVEKGQITDEVAWSVRMDLYSDAAATDTSLVGSATVSNTSTDAVTFTKGGKNALLSQGQTYYLKETMLTEPSLYQTKSVKVDGVEVSALNAAGTAGVSGVSGSDAAAAAASTGTSGIYPVKITTENNVGITVTNTYLRGFVTFAKHDADDFSTLLNGAKFAVYTKADMKKVEGASVTELEDIQGQKTGVYVADIPLVSAEATDYLIVETAAPYHYVLEDGVQLEAQLSADENVIDWSASQTEGQYLTNKYGWILLLQKYGNVSAASAAHQASAQAGDASFTLYRYDDETAEWSVWRADQPTDADGQVQWVLLPGKTYAFAETAFDAEKFWRLDSWWSGDTEITSQAQTIELSSGREVQAYVIQNVGEDLAYRAYNVPRLSVRIAKQDVGGYPEGVQATAAFSIYELDEPLPVGAAEAESVIAGLSSPVYTGATTEVGTGAAAGQTYKVWNGRDPAKNYVVVETKASSLGAEDYDTLNKDDSRVVWYQALDAVSDPDTAAIREVVLKNVYGEASVSLAKSVVENETAADAAAAADTANAVVDGKVSTPLKGDRHLVFQLKPTVTSHNQALESFTVEDAGLTFTGGETEYAITRLTVGKAQQNTAYLSGAAADAVVSAQITWTLADSTTAVSDIADLTKAVTVEAPEAAQSFSIDYFSEGVQQGTGSRYALGMDFAADPITVNVLVKQQKDGTFANPVTEITSIANAASVEMAYPKWAQDGSGTEAVERSADASATVAVDTFDTPKVKVEKTASATAVQVGKTLTYTLTLTNLSTTEKFQNPVVLDMLPTGVKYTGVYSVGAGTKGETFDVSVTRATGVPTLKVAGVADGLIGDAETGVVFNLEGALEPGSSVAITLQVKVNASAVIYGDKIENFVFLSSSKHTFHTVDNPHGYSFKDDEGAYPGPLAAEAEDLSALAKTREGGLDAELAKLGGYPSDEFIWVKARNEVDVLSSASVNLVKSIRGDRDPSFGEGDTFLANASRTNSTPGAETSGWVDYRLLVSNTSKTEKYYMVVGDVLSGVGDGISSKWDVNMRGITFVSFGGAALTSGDYDVYYYTGAISGADAALNSALTTANDWNGGNAWPQAGVTLPEGWHAAADVADLDSVTAFVIVFGSALKLGNADQILITYHTEVADIPRDEDFTKVAFENANNRFKTNWLSSTGILTSNTVSATLMDGLVQVEGDLWIDEDWDGTQEADGNRRDYSDYAIVQKFADAMSFGINDERQSASSYHADLGGTNTDIGESIKHFSFDALGTALQVRDPLYKDDALNTKALKTTDPFNYSLTATLDDPDGTLSDIFKLTSLGAGNYLSDDPDAMPQANALDNNFFGTGTTVKTKPFFMRYSANVDQSKDLGYRMERGLEITKVAADDPNVPVQGAVFEVFAAAEGDATGSAAAAGSAGVTGAAGAALTFTLQDGVYVYDESGTVTELATDAQGKLIINGLNWWKEYIIQETSAGPGYDLEDAAAAADASAGTQISAVADNAWKLEIPSEDKVTKFDKMTVTNVRKVQVQLETAKTLTVNKGSALQLQGDAFEFGVYEAAGTAGDASGSAVLVFAAAADEPVVTAKNAADGSVTFPAIEFTELGTYNFTIKEIVPAAADRQHGMAYSTEAINATVTVTWDDEDSIMKASVTYTDGEGAELEDFAFENEYTPDDAALALPVQKVISGSVTPTDKDFTFTLAGATADTPMPAAGGEVVTVSGADDGLFGTITYDQTGTYRYTVTETAGDENGYTYDTVPKQVEVTVADDLAAGKLAATWTVGGQAADAVAVTNTYRVVSTDVVIPVSKAVEGPVPSGTDKTFTFALAGATDDTPMPASGGETATITGSGSGAFGKITYTAAGVYRYTVTEVAGTAAGYTYDTAVHKAVVTVTDEDSELVATWSMDGVTEGAAAFENTYLPAPVDVALPVQKALSGNTPPEDADFTFTLAAAADESGTAGGTGTAGAAGEPGAVRQAATPMPASGGETVTVSGAGSGTFGTITFDKVGTYKYTVTEVAGTDHGYGYNAGSHTYLVTVTDTDGALAATWEMDGEASAVASFTNSYVPDATFVDIPVKKTLTGAKTPVDKKFTFTLTGESADTPMPAGTEGTSCQVSTMGAGETAFAPIDYVAAGTYKYTLSEVNSGEFGYTYDSDVREIEVTVTDTKGVLSAVWTLDGQVMGEDDTVEFTNDYEVTPDSLIIPVQKGFTGDPRPFEKDFTFTLVGATADTPMPAEGGDVVTVTDEGTAAFGRITFPAAGTYAYTIQESLGTETGYTYDTVIRQVTVTVTDTESFLEAAWAVDGQEMELLQPVEFTNDYQPVPAALVFPVAKAIVGNMTPVDKEFRFLLTAVSEDAPMPEGAEDGLMETTVMGAGAGLFAPISFKHAGVYEYTITEVATAEPGYAYDDVVYNVTATVVDNDGVLEAWYEMEVAGAEADDADGEGTDGADVSGGAGDEAVAVPGGEPDGDPDDPAAVRGAAEAAFTNTYEPTLSEVTLEATKILEGEDLKDGMFEFELLDPDGQVIQTVSNDADGRILFDPVEISQVGTYKYKIREVTGDEENVVYDDTVITAKVVVVDNSVGYLEAEVQYSNDATFVNEYEAPESPKTGDLAGTYGLPIAAMAMVAGGGMAVFAGRMRRKEQEGQR